MTKNHDIATDQDKTMEGLATDLGELIVERERKESLSVRDNQKLARLDRKIVRLKKLIHQLLNGDRDRSSPSQQKKPFLKIVE